MKLRSTFEALLGAPSDFEQVQINSDVVYYEDHIPYYSIDYNLDKNKQLKKLIGQNRLHDNSIDSKNTIWIYDSYLYLNDNHDNIYVPIMDLNIQNYVNDDTPLTKRKYKFVTFNHKPRLHRIITSSWVNENYNSLFATKKDFYYTAGFNSKEDGTSEHLIFIDKLYPELPKKIIGPNPDIGGMTTNIFQEYFYPYSSNAVFNIVNDVSFWELGCHLSEKTFWSFLSYNIPIISGYGMATYMEKIGFDMFTDIVDYSSEFIENPIDRTFKLLNDNKQILDNAHDILSPDVLERQKYNKSFLLKKDLKNIAIKKLNSPKIIIC